MENTLDNKASERAMIEQSLVAIKQHEHHMESRYRFFIDELTHLLKGLSVNKKTGHQIAQQLQLIEQTIDEQTSAIAKYTAQGQDDEARALALKTHSLHLQAKALNDLLSVLNGEKQLYDEDGQTTDSFKEAVFVLRPDLKIVKDSYGTEHLIGIHQTLDSLSIEDKAEAQKKFTKLKPDISSVKHLVQHNYHLEKQFHNQRVIATYARATSLKNDTRLMNNAEAKAKATQASIMVEMNKLPPNLHKIAGMYASMPSPSGSSSTAKAPTLTLRTLRDAYKTMINDPSRQHINQFAANINYLYGQKGNNSLKMLEKIIPGRPISPETMKFLERNTPNLTLTTINSPKPGYPSKKDHQEATYKSPTPLNTKPWSI